MSSISDHHENDDCAECREKVRQERIRWIASRGMLGLGGLVAILLIMGGMTFKRDGTVSRETGEVLIFSGVGLVVVLVVVGVLMFAAED